MDLKDLRGRITVVLTPELRQLALNQVRATITDPADPERMDLVEWFQEGETPNDTVLDAAYSEAEATMIDVLLQATLGMYAPVEAADPDRDIRVLTRH